jgi:inosine/xanthosine triphosphatase
MNSIAVGSKNPVKLEAVTEAVKEIWPNCAVVAANVTSNVSHTPMSEDEAIRGATNRAKAAIKDLDTELGIGLEGYVMENKYGIFVSGWVVAIDKKGTLSLGNCGSVLLPEKVATEVKKGRELSPVMDEFKNQKETGKNQGVWGVLTNNLVPKHTGFERGVVFALSKFINPENYK